MKIALISSPMLSCPPKNYGGSELVLWNLANGLLGMGHKVLLVAPQGSKIPKNGFLIETPPAEEKVYVDWINAERKMYDYYKEFLEDFDGIIHGIGWFGFEYLLKMKNHDLHVTHTHHGGFSWRSPPRVAKPNLIAVSKHMQEYTKSYFRQLGYTVDCRYVYNGIDIDAYPFKKDKGDRIAFIGRIDDFKRPHIAIEIAKRLNMGLDIVGSDFVGNAQYCEQVKSMCDGQQIRLFLNAPHEKKVEVYQNAKAVIFPSKMGEPFGLIVPEANACGSCVIGARDGAIGETIINGKNGFLCDIDDVDCMVEAVKKADTIDPYTCRIHAQSFFSKEVMAKNYLSLYTSILNGESW